MNVDAIQDEWFKSSTSKSHGTFWYNEMLSKAEQRIGLHLNQSRFHLQWPHCNDSLIVGDYVYLIIFWSTLKLVIEKKMHF